MCQLDSAALCKHSAHLSVLLSNVTSLCNLHNLLR